MRTFFGLSAFFCLAVAGCAGNHDQAAETDAGTGPEAAVILPALCASDARVQTFSPGMEQTGRSGMYKARLLEMAPAPAAKGDNGWTVQIVDGKGAPLDGAKLTVKPFMPDHGHGSSIVPLVTATGSEGKYTVTRLNLFMPGIWQITVNVTSSAKTTDAIVFTFCVAG